MSQPLAQGALLATLVLSSLYACASP